MYLTDNNSYEGENSACLSVVRRMVGILRCLDTEVSWSFHINADSEGSLRGYQLVHRYVRLSRESRMTLTCSSLWRDMARILLRESKRLARLGCHLGMSIDLIRSRRSLLTVIESANVNSEVDTIVSYMYKKGETLFIA